MFGVMMMRRELNSQIVRRKDLTVTIVERTLTFKVSDQRSIGIVSAGPEGYVVSGRTITPEKWRRWGCAPGKERVGVEM